MKNIKKYFMIFIMLLLCTIEANATIGCPFCGASNYSIVYAGTANVHSKTSCCGTTWLNGADGHWYRTETITKSATCTTNGTKKYACDCGYSYTESIPATGHTYGTVTYTWDGYTSCTASRTCATCGNVETGTATITNAVTKEATCTVTGTRKYTAKFSNSAFTTQTKTQSISALGHTSVNGGVELVHAKCSTCSAIISSTHNYTSSITKKVTCAETGTKKYTCNCGYSYIENIPATGHTLDGRNCINCDFIDNLIEVSGIDEDTNNVKLEISIYDVNKKEELRNELNNKMIINKNKNVIEMFELTSNDFVGTATVTFDLKYLSNVGDVVTVLHFDESKSEWENLGAYTVDDNKTITCNFTSFSPVVLVEGTINEISASADTTVYAEIGSSFTVTIPKSITLSGSNKKGEYTVSVEGDIAGTEKINVVPDMSVILSSKNLNDVAATISQDKTEWSYNEILIDNKIIGNGSINAIGISAGSWNGSFNFNISLKGSTEEYKNSIENVTYADVVYN